MSFQENTSLGKRILKGDPKSVAEAYERYYANPSGGLIPYAVALYSFRSRPECARKLVLLYAQLLEYSRRLMSTPSGRSNEKRADEADVLSTHLEWISQRPELMQKQKVASQNMALDVCAYGIKISTFSYGSHTKALLLLTQATLLLTNSETWKAKDNLAIVAREAVNILDPEQRARVYAKLGYLYRHWKIRKFFWGYSWSVRACFVRGIYPATRLKMLASLLGIRR